MALKDEPDVVRVVDGKVTRYVRETPGGNYKFKGGIIVTETKAV